jgi:hypothetical protein
VQRDIYTCTLFLVVDKKRKTTRLNLTISQDLEKKFRNEVYKRYGLRKGDIQRGIEEAIELWIKHGSFLKESNKIEGLIHLAAKEDNKK